MCRHLGYLGRSILLGELLLLPPRSLMRQSWAPEDMRGGGTINADGFGVGWYSTLRPEPTRYRTVRPLWSDATFASLAGTTSSGAVLAAVRSATVGMPVVETANAPFADGEWLFSHNGRVDGWPVSLAGLAARLPTVDLITLDAPTDSAVLWALVRDRLRAGVPPRDALAEVVAEVDAAASNSRLNLMLTNGRQLAATTWDHALSVRHTGDGVLVSSEPIDDSPEWTALSDKQLVVASESTVDIESL
ncbi:ergothioneine biosynthesis protein EgtC [Allokutzneria sp. A3M-2-11 16]|uniref:ergothioneine biosynthesis protein EgtC n=1 Tax=Allokutzneria sp. A3M-2-11 16 TaxID=2962043 RepID=UPI0020B841D6|nr:ergothioneine biosynthesis protein EgtC [Allokutzneria sp. A3M-2-11 16]MCP3802172.1 ergothioneine biosynthesis protein EgtC [Allokutzneria sp. A3M-2-11 16]